MHPRFRTLTAAWAGQSHLREKCWRELSEAYSQPHRHYHNIAHLEAMFRSYDEVRDRLEAPHVFEWAIWYHDAVYDPLRSDNEEQSALLAEKRLAALGLPPEQVESCTAMIRATQTHLLPPEKVLPDLPYLLDIDLSVLGQAWVNYEVYAREIRLEYAAYPDESYRPGRKAVLERMLARERLFQTELFFERFEARARENLAREAKSL